MLSVGKGLLCSTLLMVKDIRTSTPSDTAGFEVSIPPSPAKVSAGVGLERSTAFGEVGCVGSSSTRAEPDMSTCVDCWMTC